LRRGTRLAALACATVLSVAACGGDGATTGGGTEQKLKVGLAYDIGGRGDQSFNDAAAVGLDKAKAELGIEGKEAEAALQEPESAKEERLRILAQQGYNPVIGVGFAYAKSLGTVAKEFPDTRFAIIDDASPEATGPNIANLLFAEEQGSFLVGAAAALKTSKNNIGFVGGVTVPLIKKFEAGYIAGAKAVKPDIKVQIKYLTSPPDFSGFRDPAKGKTAAEGMFDAGADIVYHAAGGSGGGVFEAAKAAGGQAIGVDQDQALTASPAVRGVIMTSMIKRVEVATFDFIKQVNDGTFKAGSLVYDLKANGVDYSTTGGKVADIKGQLDAFKQDIISGKITVPTT
jgi:basic membrane protein A